MNPNLKLIVYSFVIFIAAATVLYGALKFIGLFSIENKVEKIKSNLNILRQTDLLSH